MKLNFFFMIFFIAKTLSFINKTQNAKIFSAGVIFLLAVLSLHAEKENAGVIYYGSTAVYGKEHVFAKPCTHHNQKLRKRRTQTTYKAELQDENETTIKKPINILPDFPQAPSSPFSFYSDENMESIIVSQHNINNYQSTGKFIRDKVYLSINNSDISEYSSEQRQKLSAAATQYGELTSFGSQSPPLPPTP